MKRKGYCRSVGMTCIPNFLAVQSMTSRHTLFYKPGGHVHILQTSISSIDTAQSNRQTSMLADPSRQTYIMFEPVVKAEASDPR